MVTTHTHTKTKTETRSFFKKDEKEEVWNTTKQKQQTEHRKRTNGGTELPEKKR